MAVSIGQFFKRKMDFQVNRGHKNPMEPPNNFCLGTVVFTQTQSRPTINLSALLKCRRAHNKSLLPSQQYDYVLQLESNWVEASHIIQLSLVNASAKLQVKTRTTSEHSYMHQKLKTSMLEGLCPFTLNTFLQKLQNLLKKQILPNHPFQQKSNKLNTS